MEVDFVAVCDAVLMAWNGIGESITLRFGVSRGWIHKWVYPKLRRKQVDLHVCSDSQPRVG